MPDALLSSRLDCPRCNERPVTTRSARGAAEITWCMTCGLAAKSAGGSSITVWNEMIDGMTLCCNSDDSAGTV